MHLSSCRQRKCHAMLVLQPTVQGRSLCAPRFQVGFGHSFLGTDCNRTTISRGHETGSTLSAVSIYGHRFSAFWLDLTFVVNWLFDCFERVLSTCREGTPKLSNCKSRVSSSYTWLTRSLAMDVDTDADPSSWSSVPECKFPLEPVSFSLPSTDDVPITQYLDSLVPDETSHMDASSVPDNSSSDNVPAGDTYASRVGRGLTSSATRSARPRRSYLSAFEKEHFHPENVTPDRPCSASFTLLDKSSSSKVIFDGLIRDGIPARAVRCLQRSPNGSVQITFSTERYRDLFVSQSSFLVGQRPVAVHPAQNRLTFVTVYDAPYELSDPALEHRLRKFGQIFSSRRGRVPGYSTVFNGHRHLRMLINTPIPSFLRFGKFLLRVSYEGQQRTCRHCHSPDHLAKDCTNEICYNCDSIGHVARSCPGPMLCCICKESGHKAIDCNLSWYRRPLSYRDAESPAESHADAGPIAADDVIDSRVEAAVSPSSSMPPDSPVDRALSSQGLLLEDSPTAPGAPVLNCDVTRLTDSEEDTVVPTSSGAEDVEAEDAGSDSSSIRESAPLITAVRRSRRKRPRPSCSPSRPEGKAACPVVDGAPAEPSDIDVDNGAPT